MPNIPRSEAITNRSWTQPHIAVGCIIKKGNEFLLVKEAQKFEGFWNQPAGWLDLFEDIKEAVKREAKEETGYEVELTGFLGVYPLVILTDERNIHGVKIIFAAEIVKEDRSTFMEDEIKEVDFFTLEEIEKLHENQKLRDPDILDEVKNYNEGKIYPLETVKSICLDDKRGLLK